MLLGIDSKGTFIVKPPLGLMPKCIWLENRRYAIEEAVIRYTDANMDIPEEWLAELSDINNLLK